MDNKADVRGLLIDMDGVLWRGETALPGVPEFFAYLRQDPPLCTRYEQRHHKSAANQKEIIWDGRTDSN